MHSSIGIDNKVLSLEAIPAALAAFALAASSALTSPSTFFWFGQMITQTLKAMIKASHIPMPISLAED